MTVTVNAFATVTVNAKTNATAVATMTTTTTATAAITTASATATTAITTVSATTAAISTASATATTESRSRCQAIPRNHYYTHILKLHPHCANCLSHSYFFPALASFWCDIWFRLLKSYFLRNNAERFLLL